MAVINGWNYAHDVKLLHLDRALQCGLVQKREKKPKLSCIQAVSGGGGDTHTLSHIMSSPKLDQPLFSIYNFVFWYGFQPSPEWVSHFCFH